MIREIFKMLNQFAVNNPTSPVNQCLSHLIQFLVDAKPFFWNAEPQRRAAKHLGHTWYIGKRLSVPGISPEVLQRVLSQANRLPA